MKNKHSKNKNVVLVRFGKAELIKTKDAKYQLRGASQDDRIAAREWVSLFLHEAVF